jgi:hypothetical protein
MLALSLPTLYFARLLALLALLGLLATTAQSDNGQVPKQLTVGEHTLILNGQGKREMLFIDLYSVALYLPQPMADVQAIRDSGIPKAFRLQFLYGGEKPDQIPASWREELLPALSPAQTQQLRDIYARLHQGDVLRVVYAPPSGTQLLVNEQPALSDRGHGLMSAFIDLFLGANPVSEDLRSALL